MALTFRDNKGSALTNTELDNNFRHFTGSHTISGSLNVEGGITGSVLGTGSYATTAATASYIDSTTIFISSSNPLPTVSDGHLAVSSSKLYFRSGSAWNEVSFV